VSHCKCTEMFNKERHLLGKKSYYTYYYIKFIIHTSSNGDIQNNSASENDN
jgi:hypothetical protein